MAERDILRIARETMVDSQIRPNHVNDSRVIAAMRALPREDFAPAGSLAYADADIRLGQGRFMPSPMLAARLAQAVLAGPHAHVLVAGANTGYLAAVLALCGAAVVALEDTPGLISPALSRLAPAVQQAVGPLAAGWPAGGPYDAILLEGAAPEIPAAFAAQLEPGGRVIAILAERAEPGGIGRAVTAVPSAGRFAALPLFDCTARIIPALQPAPAFSF